MALSPTFAATSPNADIGGNLSPSNNAQLVLLRDAIDAAPAYSFYSNRQLDRVKTKAAIKGLVMVAAAETGGKTMLNTAKPAEMVAAENAIYGLNVGFYTSMMIFASAAMMWMCVSLQRDRV